jgi:hypothetical protein
VRQYWVAPLSPLFTADGSALASSTTLTDISPTPNITIPAYLLELGSLLRWRAYGRFSTTGTPTLLLGLYYGAVAGTVICATSAVTTPSGVTNQSWVYEGEARVRTAGSSGTILGAGVAYNITTAAVNVSPATAPATATIDTTAAKALTIGAQWGTNSASNTITCHHFSVELVV